MRKNIFLSALLSLTFGLSAFAQQISGSVSDDNGVPLPGATIVIQGTSQGTTSDFDGNFSIESPDGSTLVVSYVGYESQQLVVVIHNLHSLQLMYFHQVIQLKSYHQNRK